MTPEEQLEQFKKDMEKMQKKHEDSLAALKDENNRMKQHMDDAVSKEKLAKKERKEAQEALEAAKAEATLGEEQKAKMDEIIAKKMEKAQEQFDAKYGDLESQFNETQKNYFGLKTQYDQEYIQGNIRKAAEKAGMRPEAIDDAVLRSNGIFTVGEDRAIESRDQDGQLRKFGKKIASPETFVESLRETAPHFWPESQGGGAQGKQGTTDTGVNPWAKDTLNYTEQAKIRKADPAKAERLQVAAQG